MAMQNSQTDLYPIGTDIVEMFIRRENGWEHRHYIDENGIYTSGGEYYASPIFIPISPSYRFSKNNMRIGNNTGGYAAWYDENFNFISSFKQDNLDVSALPDPPSNAAYIRISTRNLANTVNLQITRTV